LPTPIPGTAPPTFVGPDLFNPPAHRGWITLTPSITVFGAYDDNLFVTGRGTETEDVFGGFIPGFTISMQRPEYQLLAGYNFSAEYYKEETELNDVFKNQNAFLDASYRVGPRLTLRLGERFIYGRDSNQVTAGGISAGRRDSWRNTVTPSLQYQATPLTAVTVRGSYSVLRFDEDEDDDAQDSDTYRASIGAEREFTRRFVGRAEMEVAYFDEENEPATTTYTPRIGLEYQFTPTLRGLLSGGPSLVVREDEPDRITPAVRVALDKAFRTGRFLVGYERVVTAETIGVRDRQIAFASLRFTTLLRGLGLDITPRYSRSDRDFEGDTQTVDTFTVNVGATYQLARSIALIASYTFFAQREDNVEDIDQNRVFLGLQYAYPINFD
jgi:predicted porin